MLMMLLMMLLTRDLLSALTSMTQLPIHHPP